MSMMVDADEVRALREELAVFRRAGMWELPRERLELDDAVLEEAVDSLKLPQDKVMSGSDYKVLPVKRKLALNDLHEWTRDEVTAFACYSPVVYKFIGARCRTQPSFAIALKTFFIGLYHNLRNEGFLGDELFMAIKIYMNHRILNGVKQSAAMAILVHLFLVCDVFEKTEQERNGESCV